MTYPRSISERLKELAHSKDLVAGNADAVGASFCCGAFLKISLKIDPTSSVINDAAFRSNGCGYMLAAADHLSEFLKGKRLTDLHGLNDAELYRETTRRIGTIPDERVECVETCFKALRSALAEYRSSLIREFAGEKALICTCFGITEETVEELILNNAINTVDEVSNACNAGAGCGSCRMMIQEMIDSRIFAY